MVLAIQSEHSLVMCSLEALPPRRRTIPLSLRKTRVRMHKSQCAQYPLRILMVPAYAQDAVAVLLCLLAVPVFPSACLSCSCVYISFCRLALMLSFPISVFVCPCELCSPGANTRIQRGGGVIPRRCRWSFASGSVSLSLPLCLCVFQLDSSYIIGTVSLSLSFISNLS